MEAKAGASENNMGIILNSTQINSYVESYSNGNNSEASSKDEDTDVLIEPFELEDKCQNEASRGGGITCCVPHCYNNSKKRKELSYYVIPKEPVLRKKWLSMRSRKNFLPTKSHRVCSEHFIGGKKTYMNNFPTIVPKTVKKTVLKPRTTLNSTLDRSFLSPIKSSTMDIEYELSVEDELRKEVECLRLQLEETKTEMKKRENVLNETIKSLQDLLTASKFSIDRFKYNQAHFKFYTGFKSYDLFKIVLEYLQPAASSLVYWGSNTNRNSKTSSKIGKRGKPRTLSLEEEFFLILVRLRCAFPLEDMSV